MSENYEAQILDNLIKLKSEDFIKCEKNRIKALSIVVFNVIIIIAMVYIFMVYEVKTIYKIAAFLFYLLVIMLNSIFQLKKIKERINTYFKEEHVKSLMIMIFGNCEYNPKGMIDIADYYKSGMFEKKEDASYKGNDYLKIENDNVITEYSELQVSYVSGTGKNRKTYEQFKGIMFINKVKQEDIKDGQIAVDIPASIMVEFYKSMSNIYTYIILLPLIWIFTGMDKKILNSITLRHILFYIILFLVINIVSVIVSRVFRGTFISKEEQSNTEKLLGKDFIGKIKKIASEEKANIKISVRENKIFVTFTRSADIFEVSLFSSGVKKLKKEYDFLKKAEEINKEIVSAVLNIK